MSTGHTSTIKKKKDLAPLLKQSILFLTELSEDIHYLEINPENNAKSKDVKKRLKIFMKEGALPRLYDAICEIRFDINASLPYATINKDGNRKRGYYKSKFKNNNINP